MIDLSPTGYFKASANDCEAGWQVGYAHVQHKWGETNEISNESHAILWQGTANKYLDLNTLLPAGYMASAANCIEITEHQLRIVGNATYSQYSGLDKRDRPYYSRKTSPVIWQAQLS